MGREEESGVKMEASSFRDRDIRTTSVFVLLGDR
jgi:hypothetical protein